jgi:RNA polymerase sigma factor (sigma-70 family)
MEAQVITDEHIANVKKMANSMCRSLPASVDPRDLVQAGLEGLMDIEARFPGKEFGFYYTRVHGAIVDELRSYHCLSRRERQAVREGRMAMEHVDADMVEIVDDETPEKMAIRKDLVKKGLRRLSRRERQVVELYHLQEVTMKAIGEAQGVTIAAISHINARAMRKMKEALMDDYDRMAYLDGRVEHLYGI